jgi:hypothetical protein
MPNNNCLEGFQCPQCDSYAPFNIEAKIVVEVHDDGTSAANDRYDTEWDNDSWCQCVQCSKIGKVRDFYTAEEEAHETEGTANPDSGTD